MTTTLPPVTLALTGEDHQTIICALACAAQAWLARQDQSDDAALAAHYGRLAADATLVWQALKTEEEVRERRAHEGRFRALTDQEASALETFATAHGEGWRSILADAWTTSHEANYQDAATLRSLRNTHGPSFIFDTYAHGWRPDLPGFESFVPFNQADPELAKWSGRDIPPLVGDRVSARVNKLGAGVVTGYFVQDGFLGVIVRFDNPPQWYADKTQGTPRPGHLFGAEMAGA